MVLSTPLPSSTHHPQPPVATPHPCTHTCLRFEVLLIPYGPLLPLQVLTFSSLVYFCILLTGYPGFSLFSLKWILPISARGIALKFRLFSPHSCSQTLAMAPSLPETKLLNKSHNSSHARLSPQNIYHISFTTLNNCLLFFKLIMTFYICAHFCIKSSHAYV